MQNKDKWMPTKFVHRSNRLVASRDTVHVGIGSRMIADRVAGYYERHLGEHAGGLLLDLGCGHVPLFAAYRDFVTDNVCVDWRHTQHASIYLDREHDLTTALPFPNDTFNTIVASDVLEHIPNPDHFWNEIGRVLCPGGKVILNVPFFYWIHETPHDYYRHTEFALRRFAESSGFTVIKLEAIGGVPEILTDILSKCLASLPVIGTALAVAVQWLLRFVLWFNLGKRVSERTKHRFPLGYFMIAEKRSV